MKCQEYDPDEYGCMSPLVLGRCPNVPEKKCSKGWIPFWTPAERAGLKAMGREYLWYKKITPSYVTPDLYLRGGAAASAHTIGAFVSSSRATKKED